jgi:hypothetical protein
MAWERRGNGLYYYRSKRVNGKVVKEYVGAGPVASMVADAEATARQVDDMLHSERRAKQEESRERFEAVDAPISDFNEAAQVLAKAALLAAGYHRHERGEWRLRRGTPQATV